MSLRLSGFAWEKIKIAWEKIKIAWEKNRWLKKRKIKYPLPKN